MTKEVIELQEGKILRGKYAKDEIINLFKNFHSQKMNNTNFKILELFF